MFVQVPLKAVSDDRGTLVVAQDVFPFEVRRLFWVVGAGGKTRGRHRHHTTRQALIAIQGSVVVDLDDGRRTATVTLDSPAVALIVEPEDWHTMHFSDAAILLVAASHDYDAADYIHEPYPVRTPV
jgi:hypothetical protein